MSKTTNKFSPEVRERAVRLVLDNAGQHGSRWQAIMSIAAKIGCAPQTLNDWVKKAEVDSGKRAGVSSEMAERMSHDQTLDSESNEPDRQSLYALFDPDTGELVRGSIGYYIGLDKTAIPVEIRISDKLI